MNDPQTEPAVSSGDSVSKPVPGVRLKAAREARGLNLDEVASILKLDVEKIEALEHDELGHIAAPVYAAGYLRAYAKLLNLPADEIVAEFEALTRMESPPIDPTNSPAGQDFGKVDNDVSLGSFLAAIPAWLWLGVIVLIVLGGIYQTWFAGDRDISSDRLSLRNTQDAASDAPTLAPMSAAVSTSATEAESPAEAEAAPLASTGEEPAAGEVAADTPGVDEAPQASAQQQSELTLYFNDDSWVEVNDARGQRLLYRLAKTGMAQTVQGVAPFEVQLGYVPGVDIMFNGKPFDLSPYQGRRSARFRVGTANDSMANSE